MTGIEICHAPDLIVCVFGLPPDEVQHQIIKKCEQQKTWDTKPAAHNKSVSKQKRVGLSLFCAERVNESSSECCLVLFVVQTI